MYLTRLSTAASSPLQCVLPVVQLHTEDAAQGGGGLGVGHLHHVDVAVGGAEVAAVERGYLPFGLLEGRPRPVLQHPSKLTKKRKIVNEEKYGKRFACVLFEELKCNIYALLKYFRSPL